MQIPSKLKINNDVVSIQDRGSCASGRFHRIGVLDTEGRVVAQHEVPALWLYTGAKGSVFTSGNRYASA